MNTLSQRLDDAWRKLHGDGDEHDLCEVIWEAEKLAKASEEAKPVASRHFIKLGDGAYTWTRWMDYGEPIHWEVLRSEHAYSAPPDGQRVRILLDTEGV